MIAYDSHQQRAGPESMHLAISQALAIETKDEQLASQQAPHCTQYGTGEPCTSRIFRPSRPATRTRSRPRHDTGQAENMPADGLDHTDRQLPQSRQANNTCWLFYHPKSVHDLRELRLSVANARPEIEPLHKSRAIIKEITEELTRRSSVIYPPQSGTRP